MLQALNLSRPSDKHFSKRSKGGLRQDGHGARNHFPLVFYAIGNANTLAFRFDVNSGILCEHIEGAYLPVNAFQSRFDSAGQAFKWAAVYQRSFHDALSCSIGRRLAPCFARDHAQAQADLAIFGKAQL